MNDEAKKINDTSISDCSPITIEGHADLLIRIAKLEQANISLSARVLMLESKLNRIGWEVYG